MRRLSLLALVALAACNPDAGPAAGPPEPPATPSTAPLDLADALPDRLDGADRQSLEQSVDAALDAEVRRVEATYADGATLAVTDFGTPDMTMMMGHGWGLQPGAETLDGAPVQRDTLARPMAVRLLIGGRYLVEGTADTVGDAEGAVSAVTLGL